MLIANSIRSECENVIINNCVSENLNPFDAEWYLSERILAYMWDDIFQRIIVYNWIFNLGPQEENDAGETIVPRNAQFEESVRTAAGSREFQHLTNLFAEVRQNYSDIAEDSLLFAGCEEMDINDLGELLEFDDNGFVTPPFVNSPSNYELTNRKGFAYFLKMMDVMAADPCVTMAFKRDRIVATLEYFKVEGYLCGGRVIPIYFISGQGYDYIISNHGLEFIVPALNATFESPESRQEFRRRVYKIYSHRQVGSFALLVPPNNCGNGNIRDCGNSGFGATESLHTVRMNSGDNNVEQIQYDLLDFFRYNLLTSDENNPVLYNGIPINNYIIIFIYQVYNCIRILDNELLNNWSSNLREKWDNNAQLILEVQELATVSIFELSDLNLWQRAIENGIEDFIIDFLELGPIPSQEFSVLVEEGDCNNITISVFVMYSILVVLFCTPMDQNTFMHLNRISRCWQLPGSIFRRLADYMPRLKAEIWYELINGNNNLQNQYEDNTDIGCRFIFSERLEISLPHSGRMNFSGAASEEISEIIIHSNGLTLPRVCDGPNAHFLLHSWRTGSSANPLFTDSAKTASCS